MSDSRRLILIGIAVLVVLGGLRAVSELTRDDQRAQGPAGSSYAYGPYGASAYASLLRGEGRDVIRLRDRPRDLDLDPRLTVVVLWPDVITAEDARHLRRFLLRGGRLVAADVQPEGWLDSVVADPPVWTSEPLGPTRPLVPVPETAGVRRVAAGIQGRFVDGGSALPVLGSGRSALAVVARVGAGRAILLADPAPLLNSRLAVRDDALFALNVAGPDRPVAFVESVHGFGRASGWGALPGRFKGALVLLALAGAALVLARGRRLGPAQPAGRELAPPRAAYAEGLAGALVRSGPAEDAIAPVVEEARGLLLAPAGSGDDELLAAARRLGLSDDEADAIVHGATTGPAALAAARGLARMNEMRGEP